MSENNIRIIVQAVDEASKQLKKVASGIDKLSGKLGGLKDVAKTAAGVMLGELAHDALGALTKAGGEASAGFMEYEETLTKIVSATSATGEEAVKLRDKLAAVSEAQTDLGFTAADSAKALEALVKAGMSGSDAAEALRSALSLARLEGISTEEAAGLLVQTLTMFGLSAKDSASAMDSLSKAADAGIDTAEGYAKGLSNCGAAAANMGLSLDETLAALVELDKTYGDATVSGTYLNAMFKDLIAKSDDLRISLYNADGSMRSLDDIVGQLRSKVQGFGDDQEAVNQYLSVFDVRAQRAVLGLINYDGSIADTMKDMDSARGVQEKMNMVMDTTAGKMAEAQAEIDNASYALGEMTAQMTLTWKQFALGLGPIGAVADALGPSLLQGAMSGFMMMIPQLISSMGGASAAFSTFATVLTGPVGIAIIGAIAAGALLYEAWTNDWGGIRTFVTETAIPAIQSGINTFIGWLQGAWNTACDAVSNAWNTAWTGIQNFINDPIGSIQGAVSSFGNWLTDTFSGVTGQIFDMNSTFWQAMEQLWPEGASYLQNVTTMFKDFITGNWGALGEDLVNIVTSFWNMIKSVWDNFIGAIQAGWDTFCNAIVSVWDTVVGPFVDVVQGFANAIKGVFDTLFGWIVGGSSWTNLCYGIVNVWNSVVQPLVGTVQGFCDSVSGFFSGLKSSVTNAWNGMVNGLQSAWNSFASTISDAVSGFTGAVGDAFSSLANFLTGGSIWPDMLNSMVKQADEGLKQVHGKFKDGMEKVAETVEGTRLPELTANVGVAGKPVLPYSMIPAGGVGGTAPSIMISGPLVYIQGTNEEIARYVRSKLVRELRDTLIKATSTAQPHAKKIVLPKTFAR